MSSNLRSEGEVQLKTFLEDWRGGSRALTALLENSGSGPSSHVVIHQPSDETPTAGNSVISSGLYGHAHNNTHAQHSTNAYEQAKQAYTKNK